MHIKTCICRCPDARRRAMRFWSPYRICALIVFGDTNVSLRFSLLRGFPPAGPSSSSSHLNMLTGLMVPQANCRALNLTLILRYINQRDVTQSDDTTVNKNELTRTRIVDYCRLTSLLHACLCVTFAELFKVKSD